MPRARANIRAKFIAQIEMSSTCVPRYRDPADAASPRIVSSSGNPAAASEPNARTRMASVTGQLISSDFIIAVLLAWLKSDHSPEAPVTAIWTRSLPSARTGSLRSSAARTMSLLFAAAPAMTTTV